MKYNIQDRSPDAPLGKIFARMNAIQQARYVRPAPPAQIYYRYDSSGWVDVSDPQDAIIAPGANIQTIQFWNRLYELCEAHPSLFYVPPEKGGMTYPANWTAERIPNEQVKSRQYINDLSLDGTRRMIAGDIIGSWLIDDLTDYLNQKRFFVFDFSNAPTPAFQTINIVTGSNPFNGLSARPVIALQTRSSVNQVTGRFVVVQSVSYSTNGVIMRFENVFAPITAQSYALSDNPTQAFGLQPGYNLAKEYSEQECVDGVLYDRTIISPTYNGESAESIIGAVPAPGGTRQFGATASIVGVFPLIEL